MHIPDGLDIYLKSAEGSPGLFLLQASWAR